MQSPSTNAGSAGSPKIGIVTIVDQDNYGNRLQNFAAQEVLRTLGTEPSTILFGETTTSVRTPRRTVSAIIRRMVAVGPQGVARALRERVRLFRQRKIRAARAESFSRFTREYIKEVKTASVQQAAGGAWHEAFDYFVIGSDQVWNPNRLPFLSQAFAEFAPKYKRIAYAPSFGVSELPPELLEFYMSGLAGIATLSVRENVGAGLIRELTGVDAPVLVDPTLMLSRGEWSAVCRPHGARPKRPYIVTYLLGGADRKRSRAIVQLARREHLELVRLADPADKSRYDAGPSEFLDYIRSAELVITDSFHAAVFCLHFEKRLILLDRGGRAPSMNSRMDTFMETFALKSQRYDGLEATHRFITFDSRTLSATLNIERERAREYLRRSMHLG